MKQRRQDFALGLTALVMLGLLLGTILFLYPLLHARGWGLEVHFRHEDGMAPLKSGSAVLLGGSLEVGRVREVRVEEVDDPSAPDAPKHTVFVVHAEISSDIKLHGNCEITTDQPTIGGSGFVEILKVGTPDVPLVQPIQGLPPESLGAAIGALSRRLLSEGGLVDHLDQALDPELEGSLLHKVVLSLDDMNAMTRELRAQINPRDQKALLSKVHLILDSLNVTTAALRTEMAGGDQATLLGKVHAALDELGRSLTEATAMLKEDRPLIKDTLTSVERASRTVDRELLAALLAELDPANASSLLGKVHLAMDGVNASLDDIQAMTTTGERMVAVSRPKLEKAFGHLVAAGENLEQGTLELLLNPSKLLWGPGPQRQEQLVVFQAARNFAEAATQLDNAAGRLEAVLSTLPPEGRVSEADNRELRAIHDSVRAAFQRFERAEEALWEQLK